MFVRRLLAAAVLLAVAMMQSLTVARADVSKYGNFSIGYTDATSIGGLEMNVDRVYNSFSTDFSGIFGVGWGCDFEAYIQLKDDGTLVLHEYGGGVSNTFAPPPTMARSTDTVIDELMAAADRAGRFTTAQDRDTYRAYLQQHHEAVWESERANNLVPPIPQPAGETYTSLTYAGQQIIKTATGYEWRNGDKVDDFDGYGRLVHVFDKNRNYIAYTYDSKGNLSEMSDNVGNVFHFTFTPDGHVKTIADSHGHVASYRYHYSPSGTVGYYLVYSKDVDGNVYRYDYDYSNGNMTAVLYSNHTSVRVTYTQDSRVASIRDRNGTLTRYYYSNKPLPDNGNDHTFTIDTYTGNKRSSLVSYEYFIDGADRTTRMITNQNGDVTDETYDQAGYPLSIKEGDDVTRFQYDAQERVTLKETAAQRIEYAYDPVTGKVSQVTTTVLKPDDGSTPPPPQTERYTYDLKGNLIAATDGSTNDVVLTYDDQGRIASIANQGKTLRFGYNRLGKATSITVDGLGTMHVTYDANGDIKDVTSDQGHSIAVQVSAMIQQLLDIVRPAGVSLDL